MQLFGEFPLRKRKNRTEILEFLSANAIALQDQLLRHPLLDLAKCLGVHAVAQAFIMAHRNVPYFDVLKAAHAL
ncbi:MAG: hypothetical protein HYW49_02940 [Deltaproteobacteria bacterium]|nr:hypothetical protein [Deltaproteobacteria bacterium]